jgi:VWFA-related protein
VKISFQFATFLLSALLSAAVARGQAAATGPDATGGQAVQAASTDQGADSQGKGDSGYMLHVNVKLVNVFTNVTDATGAIVGGLTKDDFALAEDGRPQKIAVFERQSELPLSLVLAIDTSGSVHKDLPLEQDAAKRFVHALLRGQDQISLLEFSTDVRQVVPFTNQANRIDRGLSNLHPGPATALYDAIYLASDNLAKQPSPGSPGARCWCS